MEIIVAKTAGFCFGVDRAVTALNKMVVTSKDTPIYTYGPIIHNPQVVNDFVGKGIEVVNQLEEFKDKEGKVLIRSHGISEEEENQLKKLKLEIKDCTCPYVKKIHKIVRNSGEEGYDVIIVGNPKHPEIVGIAGWARSKTYIVESCEDIDKLNLDKDVIYSIVAQTTFNKEKYNSILNELQKKSIRVIINETICKATEERQMEAYELAKKVTKMIVIGGKNSSNTKKLYEICKNQCKMTYYIETIEELELNLLDVNDIIGITAGASTPKYLIEEVISNVRNAKF